MSIDRAGSEGLADGQVKKIWKYCCSDYVEGSK